jgi:hypothetical protein
LHYLFSLAGLTILLGSAAILFYSCAYRDLTDELKVVRFSGVALGSVAIIICALATPKTEGRKTAQGLVRIWVVLAISFTASSIVNSTLSSEVPDLIWMGVGIPIVCFSSASKLIERYSFAILLEALALSHGTLIAISFAFDSDIQYRYLGLFGDPNQLGMAALMCLPWVLGTLQTMLTRGKSAWTQIVLLVMLFELVMLLIIASSHRSSLVAAVSCTLVAVLTLPRRGRVRALAVLGLCLLSGAMVFTLKAPRSYVEGFIAKGLQDNNGLEGRLPMWRVAVREPSWFGHGREYLNENTNRLGAHNSFLHIFGTRGYLACGIFVVLSGYTIFLVFRQRRLFRHRPDFYVFPMLVLVAYWELSLTEGMFSILGHGIHLGFLIAIGGLARGGPAADSQDIALPSVCEWQPAPVAWDHSSIY